MEDRFTIEAKKTFTGCMLSGDCKDEPVRYSPVRYYLEYRDNALQTLRQILAYSEDDRTWFDTYAEAVRVIERFNETLERAYDEAEARGGKAYWHYEAHEWRVSL